MNQKLVHLVLAAATITLLFALDCPAHPLGSFTINHYTRIEPGPDRIRLRYVVDMAEIAAFQELQRADANGDGETSEAELREYADSAAARYLQGCSLELNGNRIELDILRKDVSLPPGSGGLATLRFEFDYAAPVKLEGNVAVRYKDANDTGRLGWRELLVTPADGVVAFNGNVYGSAVTDELRSYPADWVAEPLSEADGEFFVNPGILPLGAVALKTREGRPVVTTRDRLSDLITVRELTPTAALLGLLLAALLGSLHAMSPGHGKTIVGAYLVGSRGTVRHAAFLGLTVTVTHTAGVFALGLITLFASKYVLPETLAPVLTLISGGSVLVIGISLIRRRVPSLLTLRGSSSNSQLHEHDHSHDSAPHTHEHTADHNHDHGPAGHSHLPPGADGSPVTWQSLLALGVSGGIVPCPSALVVLLSAISLHRVGYGLLLVTSFSFGLAAVLTAVGLLFVYAGRLISKPLQASPVAKLIRLVPVLSSLFITVVGAAICYEAVGPAGLNLLKGFSSSLAENNQWFSLLSLLGIGFLLGLKHAVEADHLAAVTVIATESKSMLRSSLVGAVWGIGHTISLSVAGIAVIVFRVTIGERTALLLEVAVGVMLITLGLNAFRRVRRDAGVHSHEHRHEGHIHSHVHPHRTPDKASATTLRGGLRPLLVGMMHGLAGSAALVVLVVATTQSVPLGLAYIAVFGLGSTGGMMLVSAVVSLPFSFARGRVARAGRWIRLGASAFSVALGLLMVLELGIARWL